MHCPKCKTEYTCPCNSCAKRWPDKPSNFRFTEDGNHEECLVCGFTAHCDWWFDWQFQCMYEAYGTNNLTEINNAFDVWDTEKVGDKFQLKNKKTGEWLLNTGDSEYADATVKDMDEAKDPERRKQLADVWFESLKPHTFDSHDDAVKMAIFLTKDKKDD